MNPFSHMRDILISSDAFKDTSAQQTISQEDFDQFLKEFTFEKLKGKKLGECFAQKFSIHDRILYMMNDEESIIKHIEYCKYIK
jgi:Txe/YoeB family toxin of Txe-Axe toxin-antitoxin module